MPIQTRHLLLMEAHLIQAVARHASIPDGDEAILASTGKHVFIDVVPAAAINSFFAHFALDDC